MRLVDNVLTCRRRIIGVALAFAVAVIGAACTGQLDLAPGAQSISGQTSGSSVWGVTAVGNCPGGSGTKDESAPFTVDGASGVVIKAGTPCYGPYFADTVVVVDGVQCFIVDFEGSTVTVSSHPDAIGRVCKGISHIEAGGGEPPCEKDCEPPPPPPCEGKDCEVVK